MARSPAHKFGQIIGDLVEASIQPLLEDFAQQNGLYLDTRGPRSARSGKKVAWTDEYGNKHDLDFVLERNGSDEQIGIPIAFIESAWRRYTKHSRNKAQEIQGAIMPLVSTHSNAAPFFGVILAGVFTEGAINQLRSRGFTILYFQYDTVISAFKRAGINANFNEDTPESVFSKKVRQWEKLSQRKKNTVAKSLIELNSTEVKQFIESLEKAVNRHIIRVIILPLHGSSLKCNSIDQAIKFIEEYNEDDGEKPIVKYEIEIRYNNQDLIKGEFTTKEEAVRFLHSYQPPSIIPLRE